MACSIGRWVRGLAWSPWLQTCCILSVLLAAACRISHAQCVGVERKNQKAIVLPKSDGKGTVKKTGLGTVKAHDDFALVLGCEPMVVNKAADLHDSFLFQLELLHARVCKVRP